MCLASAVLYGKEYDDLYYYFNSLISRRAVVFIKPELVRNPLAGVLNYIRFPFSREKYECERDTFVLCRHSIRINFRRYLKYLRNKIRLKLSKLISECS